MPFYESNEDTRGFAADQWSQQAQGRVADQWAASAVADAPDRAAAAEQAAQQAAQQQAQAQAAAAAEAQRQAQEQAQQQAAAAAEAARQQAAAQQAAADQWAGQAQQQAASVASTQTDAASQAPPQMTQQATIDSSSPEAFIRSITPWAQQISQQTGIPAAAMIGMAANETGYGKFAAGNNLFGIKGTNGPAGSINSQTWEDYGNGPVTIRSNFKAYTNPGESFQDFADLVMNAPRYAAAKGQSTVEGFVQALKDGGYMTDPAYVGKISSIVQRFSGTINDAMQGAGQAVGGAVQDITHGTSGDHPLGPPPVDNGHGGTGQVYETPTGTWNIAFGFNQPYGSAQFNQNIPNHRGVDLTIPGAQNNGRGTPYTAFQPGTVVALTHDPAGGNGIIVQTADGLYNRYFHNDRVLVGVGDKVDQNTQIGVLGASGTEGFPHLHFEVSRGINGDPTNQLIDPRPYMMSSGGAQGTGGAQPAGQPATTPAGRPGSQPAAPAQPQAQTMAQFVQQYQDTRGRMPTDTELGNFVLSQPPQQTAASVGTPQPIQQPSSPFDVVGNIASGLGGAVSGAVSGATGALAGLFGRGGPGGQPSQGPTETAPAATASPFPGLPQLPTGMALEGGGYGAGGPLLTGEAASAFAPVGQAVTGLASSPLLPTNLTNAGLQAAGQVIAPFFANPLDAAQTYTEIQRRYGGGIDPATGRFRAPDFSNITPEDEQALANATMAVGGVASPLGEGGTASIRAMTGGASDRIPGILGGTRGVVADSPAIRQVVENAAPVSANADRFYHGTGADFPRPDAAKFDPDGLFGPGYYLTSDPRVAGGVIAEGGEIAREGRTFSSASQRGPDGRLMPVDTTYREPGEVISSGYAQQRDVDPSALAEADRLEQALQNATPQYRTDNEGWMQEQIDRLRGNGGPNVRAVDVPKDLNLLNVDAPVTSATVHAIADQLPEASRQTFVNRVLPAENTNPMLRINQRGRGPATGEELYRALDDLVPFDQQGQAPANRILARAGFDGIQYAGGQRTPMFDRASTPIEHTAVVVFPDSLDKLTNATAGTRGGLLPDLTGESAIGRIAGRAAIGGISAGAQQAQQPGATPQDIALAALQGAALGVGREALLRNLPAGARLSATLARAVEEQGGIRPPEDAPVSGTAGGLPSQIGGFFQGTQGAMGESILQADVQRLQAQMDAARAKFPEMTNAEAAATPLGQQIESVRQQLVQRTGASPPPAAPVSGTAGGNLPVEQIPEFQAVAAGGAGEPPIQPPTAVGAPSPAPEPEPGLLNRLTQGQPEQAGNITLSKYPEDVRQVISDAASSLPDQMKAATRGVVPDQAVRDLSQQTGMDVDQIVRNWNPGQAQNAETLLALRDALTAQARKVIDAQQALRTAPDSAAARGDLLQALTQHAAIQEVVSGSTAEAGRALRQFRQAAAGSDFAINQINQMAARSGMTPEEMASALGRVDLSDPAAVAQLARSLPQGAPTLAEIFKTYHTNNVISGLPTLTHVAVNSILAPAWSFTTRSLADLAGLNFDRVQGGGIGFGAGLAHAGEDFLSGFSDVFNNPASVANRLGGAGGAALKAQGVFGALHGAFQNVAQGIIERTEIGRLAGEAATDQGLKGVAWTKFVADALDNPSATMAQQARGVAERAALRGELGTLGQKMQQIANVPFIGNTLFPVVKISTNALTQGIERSPLGLLGTGFDVARAARGVGPYAKGFEPVAGGVTPLSERLTNNLAGTAVTAFLVNKALDGTITGDGPTDPKERAALTSQGWQANSLYVPGRGYVDYRVLGPLAQDFALAGNYADAVEEARKHPGQPTLGQNALEIAGNLAQRQASYMSDATGLRTLGQIYEVLHGGANAANVAAQFFGQMAGGFVPESAAVRGLVSATDPYARQPQRGDIGEVIAQGLPGGTPGIGGRTDLPVRLNEMGQPESNPQAGLGIFVPRTGTGTVSPVMTLLGSEGLSPPSAPKTVRVGQREIELSTDEQRQYQQLRGALLEQMMTPLTQNQQFAQAPGSARKVVLQRLVNQADQVAQRQLIGTIAQTGDLASRLGPGPRQQEPVPFRPPIPLTELTPATPAATSNRAAALPLTSDLATLDPLQQEQMRRQLAGTP